MQVLMDCCIWLVIPGNQKHSYNKDRVWSWPLCPASLWHPIRVVTWCAFGTMKSSRSSFSPLGIEHRYRAFWWIMKFCRFCKISWPSSLEACSPKSIFRSVFFWASNQSKTVLSTGSSLLACTQSHAFGLIPALWWHRPLAPSHGHPQLWWGHELLPDVQPPGLFHWGWISPCLDQGRL